MDSQVILDLSDRWWNEIWREGNLDVLDDIFTDPFMRHSAAGTAVTSRQQYKRVLADFQRILHRPVTMLHSRDIAGDRLWTRATSRGVNLETGEPSLVTWLLLQRIDRDRVAEHWALTVSGVDWSA